jgi:hypothetical protein
MAGLDPAIHDHPEPPDHSSWMPGPSPGMNDEKNSTQSSTLTARYIGRHRRLILPMIVTTELDPSHLF